MSDNLPSRWRLQNAGCTAVDARQATSQSALAGGALGALALAIARSDLSDAAWAVSDNLPARWRTQDAGCAAVVARQATSLSALT